MLGFFQSKFEIRKNNNHKQTYQKNDIGLTAIKATRSLLTCLIGSGTRYLQVILIICTAVSSDMRWPTEINIGFNVSGVDLIACKKIGEKKKLQI